MSPEILVSNQQQVLTTDIWIVTKYCNSKLREGKHQQFNCLKQAWSILMLGSHHCFASSKGKKLFITAQQNKNKSHGNKEISHF
jgi:hypothetical protein